MSGRTTFTVAFLCVVAAPALAGIEAVRVRVDGMSCPFCTYNIEKRVKKLAGVGRGARVVTSLKSGTVKFPWKEGMPFDSAAIRKAVHDAGFTPRGISVTLVGDVRASAEPDSRTALRVVDEKAKLAALIEKDKRADREESWSALNMLAEKSSTGVRARVEGAIRAGRGGGTWSLVLERWAPLDFGSEVIAEVKTLACETCSTRTMRALSELDDVIHVEADHVEDRVTVWTRSSTPDLATLRQRIESLGFKVTHVHERTEEK